MKIRIRNREGAPPSVRGEMMAKMIRQRPTHLPRTVEDHRLRDKDCKEVRLSSPFGKRECLVVLHNMGKTCPHCALCGDEFHGMLHHLEEDAGFYVVGPDDPKTRKAYVKERVGKPSSTRPEGPPSKRFGFRGYGGPRPTWRVDPPEEKGRRNLHSVPGERPQRWSGPFRPRGVTDASRVRTRPIENPT